ncbi:MAG: AAA family ATPase [Gammaproteobacteria bacterium]
MYTKHRESIQKALDDTLKEFAKVPRFMNWKHELTANGKMTKVPVNRWGYKANSHDPANWMMAEEALHYGDANDLGVAFVFAKADCYAFVDLDHCIVDGVISAFAYEILAMFPGAYVETSQSGTGLHIFFKYSGEAPLHKSKYTSPDGTQFLELYTELRFVALTCTDAYGAAGMDCTDGLARLISLYLNYSESEAKLVSGYIPQCWDARVKAGQDPNWRGIIDDDELIEKARKSVPQDPKVIFGGYVSDKVMFEHWWVPDTAEAIDALSKAYPHSTKSYDESSADAGLAASLAFRTGADPERILRLMMRSGLVRPKWERADYLKRTILNACDWYDKGMRLKETASAPAGSAAGDESQKFATTNGTLTQLDVAGQAPDLGWRDVSIVDLFTNPPQSPQFLIADILPAQVLTLLSAHGGVGKSQLALQAAVCLAFGLPFMGKATKQCRVLFYSAEDSQDILRYRLERICTSMQLNLHILDKNLTIIDATQNPCLYLEVAARRAETTQGYGELKTRIGSCGYNVTIIDNASDTYDANENDRGQVRGFIRLLVQLNATVLLLAHVPKQIARKQEENQEGYSGSTAWHNSARSRLLLTKDEKDLTLTHQKSNHGQLSDPIYMSWPDNGILTHMQRGKLTVSDDPATSNAVLALVAECSKRKDPVSSKTGGNVPSQNFKRLSVMPGFPISTVKSAAQLSVIFEYLLSTGRLAIVSYKDASRNSRTGYEIVVSPTDPLLVK